MSLFGRKVYNAQVTLAVAALLGALVMLAVNVSSVFDAVWVSIIAVGLILEHRLSRKVRLGLAVLAFVVAIVGTFFVQRTARAAETIIIKPAVSSAYWTK